MIPVVLPLFVAVLYAITGVWHLRYGNYGLGIMWIAYAVANVGLVMAGEE